MAQWCRFLMGDSKAVLSVLRRYFIVATALAIGIATLAAVVNLVIGPFNIVMWLFPMAMLLFAALTLVFVDAAVRQAEDPDVVPWMVRRLFGKRVAYFLRWANMWNARIVSRLFLTAVPLFFLVFATLLLFFSITGQTNSGS